jgi:hypothetical protein
MARTLGGALCDVGDGECLCGTANEIIRVVLITAWCCVDFHF